jgi:hypothetical protein
MHHREPQASSAARLPRREEGLEDARQDLRRHADTGVSDLENDERSGPDVGILPHPFPVERAVLERQTQPSSPRHRIAGVHAQVGQYLVNLCLIRRDPPEILGGAQLKIDVLWERVADNELDTPRYRDRSDGHPLPARAPSE